MPLSSKFFTLSIRDKIVKIDQYLAKIWTKCDSLLFWPTLYVKKHEANAFNMHVPDVCSKFVSCMLSRVNGVKLVVLTQI